MALYEFAVMNSTDRFELEDQPLGALSFPCCCCSHKGNKDSDHPCNVCGHNLNIDKEAAEAVRG